MATAALAWGIFGGIIATAQHRAEYWRPVFEGLATRADTAPITGLWVLPFKGCGLNFGETVYAKTKFAGVPADLAMCRTTQGVRFDITTYESRWIRGPKSRDTDGSPQGTDPKGLDGKAATAGAEGIAQFKDRP